LWECRLNSSGSKDPLASPCGGYSKEIYNSLNTVKFLFGERLAAFHKAFCFL